MAQNLFQDGGRRRLKFPVIVPFGIACDSWTVHIYLNTEFGVNRSKLDRGTPFCVFLKMAAAAIFDLLLPILDHPQCPRLRVLCLFYINICGF